MSDDNGSWSRADLEAMAWLPTLEGRTMADLGAQVAALRADLETCAAHNREWCARFNRMEEMKTAMAARAEQAEAERDAAVQWIGVVRDELTRNGWPAGDRDVALANLRGLLSWWQADVDGDPVAERDAAHSDVARLRAALCLDQPWPVQDVLRRLSAAAQHFLDDHDCDHHGWELDRGAALRAPEIADAIDAALRATCPACHGTGTNGERKSDGAPLVCGECGR